MAVAQIDNLVDPPFQFVELKGGPQGFLERLQKISRAGTDGEAWRKLGLSAQGFPMKSMTDVADAAAAKALFLSYFAQVGSSVDLTTEQGIVWNDVLVVGLTFLGISPVLTMVGGLEADPTYILEFSWIFNFTELP